MRVSLIAIVGSGGMPFPAVWVPGSALCVGPTAARAGLAAHLTPQPLGQYRDLKALKRNLSYVYLPSDARIAEGFCWFWPGATLQPGILSETRTGKRGVNPGVTPALNAEYNTAVNEAVNQGLSSDFSTG